MTYYTARSIEVFCQLIDALHVCKLWNEFLHNIDIQIIRTLGVLCSHWNRFFINISIFDKNNTIGYQVIQSTKGSKSPNKVDTFYNVDCSYVKMSPQNFKFNLFQDYFHRKNLQSSLKLVCLFLSRLHLLPWSLLEKISKPKTKLTSKRLPRLINLG